MTPSSVLVTGSGGRLGRRLVPLLQRDGWATVALPRALVDRPDTVLAVATDARPALVLCLAGYTSVSGAERDPVAARQGNERTARAAADAVAALVRGGRDVALVYVSTDYVLGAMSDPGPHAPLPIDGPGYDPGTEYARTKLAGERAALAAGHVVRIATLCPEDVERYAWVNAYTLSTREWVEDTAERLARWLRQHDAPAGPGGVHHLGPPDVHRTRADLVAGRYPRHPCLRDRVADPDEHRRRAGYAAPVDTRFAGCAPLLGTDAP